VFHYSDRAVQSHAHVIASDPARDPGHVVVVSLSSKPGDGDAGYTLEFGDHVSISHRTYVRCDFAGLTTVTQLQEHLRKQEITISQCLQKAALQKVQRALGESPRPSRELKAILKEQGFIK
jgi:hypothetical protein